MFRRIRLFFQAMKAVKAARAGGDIDAEVDALLHKAGFDGASGGGGMAVSGAAADLLYEPPFAQLYPDTPVLNQAHVALIRRMRLGWNGAEVGAPQCHPEQSFAGGKAPDLVRAALGDLPDEEVAEFMVSLVPALQQFMAQATLAPGTYPLSNMTADLLAESQRGLENADTLFAIGSDMRFAVEAEDILLAKHAQWQWPDEGDMFGALERGDIAGPTVDPKRPYGEMSYIDLDIHRILDWPVEQRNEKGFVAITDAQAEAATRLHFRQLGTMQAFLEHAEISVDPA